MPIKFDERRSSDPAADQLVNMLWAWNGQLPHRSSETLGEEGEGPPAYAIPSAARLLQKYGWIECIEALIGFVINHEEDWDLGDFSALARVGKKGRARRTGKCQIEMEWRKYRAVGKEALKKLRYEIIPAARMQAVTPGVIAAPWKDLVLNGLRRSGYGPARKRFSVSDLPEIGQTRAKGETETHRDHPIKGLEAIREELAELTGIDKVRQKTLKMIKEYIEEWAEYDWAKIRDSTGRLEISSAELKKIAKKLKPLLDKRTKTLRPIGP